MTLITQNIKNGQYEIFNTIHVQHKPHTNSSTLYPTCSAQLQKLISLPQWVCRPRRPRPHHSNLSKFNKFMVQGSLIQYSNTKENKFLYTIIINFSTEHNLFQHTVTHKFSI